LKTFYDVLGVAESATHQDITRAYRKAAMKWHPDRNHGNEVEANARFKELADAREVLTDPKSRAEYDKSLPTRLQDHALAEQAEVLSQQAQMERWIAIAASVAKLGLSRDTVVGSLVSKGCAADVAALLADQAIASRGDNTKQRAGINDQNSVVGKSKIAKWVVLACGTLAVLAGLYFAVPWSELTGSEPSATGASVSSQQLPNSLAGRSSADWSDALPREVTGFSEKSGWGHIKYSSLPDGPEFDSLRQRLGSPFDLKLLQMVPMSGQGELLLFASTPPDFGCHECRPILSAMLLRGNATDGYQVLIPLRAISIAGSFGKLSLQDDRRASILAVGPGRDGFVFKDADSSQGTVTEWKNLFAIEGEKIRPLGSYPVHSDSIGNGSCEEPRPTPCALKDTRVQFSRDVGPGGFFDIRASETEVDPPEQRGAHIARQYVLRFDGHSYVRVSESHESPGASGVASASGAAAASDPAAGVASKSASTSSSASTNTLQAASTAR